jgi:hypothetical protein
MVWIHLCSISCVCDCAALKHVGVVIIFIMYASLTVCEEPSVKRGIHYVNGNYTNTLKSCTVTHLTPMLQEMLHK